MEPFNTSHSNQTELFIQASWRPAILIATLAIGLPANAFIIWLTGWRLQRRGLSVFILSLATSDFLFLSTTVMQSIETLLNETWVLGTAMCQLRYVLSDLSYHCSLFLLAALSVDRCLLVLLPLWYHCHRPLRLSCYICLGAWLVAALLSIKGFVFADVVLYPDGMLICSSNRGKYEWPLRLLEVLVEGLFPFVVMVTTHVATLSRTFRLRIRPPSKFYYIVAATLSAYVLLNFPFQIVQLLFLVSWEHEFNYRIFPFMVYFGYLINLNSSINPLIYIFFGSNICSGCGCHTTSSLAMALTEEQGKSPGDTPSMSNQLLEATRRSHTSAKAQFVPFSQPRQAPVGTDPQQMQSRPSSMQVNGPGTPGPRQDNINTDVASAANPQVPGDTAVKETLPLWAYLCLAILPLGAAPRSLCSNIVAVLYITARYPALRVQVPPLTLSPWAPAASPF
uniref:G-protein coupled receptors family 1 profile domain-containing protein n=1 Tax=Gopherus evgoodei TaxID=1825980 RepID=A0A8C4WUG4_9SAUR